MGGELYEGKGFAGKVKGEEVGSANLDEAGGGTVGTGKPFTLSHGTVHNEMNSGARRQDGAEDGGGSDFDAGELPEFVGRSEGDARNPERAAELPRHERLVVSGHIEVELRLLAVAEEQGLHDMNAYLRVNVLTILHRQARIRVHALKGNAQRGKGRIDRPLKLRLELLRRKGDDVAYFEHREYFFRAAASSLYRSKDKHPFRHLIRMVDK